MTDNDSFLTIYKIQCKDKSITHSYIGSTGRFNIRIQCHISSAYNKNSNSYNTNLYKLNYKYVSSLIFFNIFC